AGYGGNDTLDGGPGFDFANYFDDVAVTVSLAIVGEQNTGGAGLDTLLNIEGLTGSNTGNDILTGDTSFNTLAGVGGNDTLNGSDG
ncbi:hypothetical protein, partial [Enterococcus casseliflavus]|uniref:hypothetical protein n=1 Tax=Enterococcus casseliflavus TaxID=37734 RepID=UPI003D0DCFC8